MKRFKNILLVAGPESVDEETLQRAGELAIENKGRLTIVEVIEELPEAQGKLTAGMKHNELVELILQGNRKQLEQHVAPLEKKGVEVNIEILTGTPFLEIIQQVYRGKHDLVMISSEEEEGLGSRLFGSTPLRLIRKCPCPVWVVKAQRSRKYFRILAAVDPTTPDDEHDSLNHKILELATSLTELDGAELHVGHAWSMWSEESLKNRTGVPPNEVELWAKETKAVHRKLMNKMLKEHALDKLEAQVHFVKGKPTQVIPNMVEKKRIDLLVMGSVCRTGITGFFIGNTAEEILSKVNCSVLVVKPEGFVSPVRPEK